jgi:hypothetical protein
MRFSFPKNGETYRSFTFVMTCLIFIQLKECHLHSSKVRVAPRLPAGYAQSFRHLQPDSKKRQHDAGNEESY